MSDSPRAGTRRAGDWVTPSDVRAVAQRRYRRDHATWAAGGRSARTAPDVIDVPLHPPSERVALADLPGATAWAESWRAAHPAIDVTWQERRWSAVGNQRVPVRARVDGADAIADLAGEGARWRRLERRLDGLRAHWFAPGGSSDSDGPSVAGPAGLVGALRRVADDVAGLDEVDLARVVTVVDWVRDHPESGAYVRSLPVRGIDSKWLEGHRAVVERLHAGVTGRSELGLRRQNDLIRIRILDEAVRPGGISELALPLAELAAVRWPIAPQAALILENVESLVALPDIPGAVAVHGAGHAVGRLRDVPWLGEVPLAYWGDLDTHGFRALHHARESLPRVESVLMDAETLDAHRDLWGTEPAPHTGELPLLTPDERTVLEALREHGNVRLEQERIAWAYALARLRERLEVLTGEQRRTGYT
ncbi:Wadjet anti-phage system protein JetD domain-containing protein [Miniimonas arenae]|uniref:Wadjet anti-phage system protein JetD domain-containing protein n=1 Tax=Miniimonas arenae TaxID=676201 RepID=UPI0015D58FE2|nr:DUF3322 and DUF2220 domain-containing protein [Miniimonas arenae]